MVSDDKKLNGIEEFAAKAKEADGEASGNDQKSVDGQAEQTKAALKRAE